MPHQRDDAPSARKLRRPAALLVATLSGCGKKTVMPGSSTVKKVASRNEWFLYFGRVRRFESGSLVTPGISQDKKEQ